MPLLVLTAGDAVSDRVRGLQAGADDYLLKPLRPRRTGGAPAPCCGAPPAHHGSHLAWGVTFEPSSGQAWLHGEPVELSRRERTLLATLLQHPQAILSAEQLRDRLWAGAGGRATP